MSVIVSPNPIMNPDFVAMPLVWRTYRSNSRARVVAALGAQGRKQGGNDFHVVVDDIGPAVDHPFQGSFVSEKIRDEHFHAAGGHPSPARLDAGSEMGRPPVREIIPGYGRN